MPLVFQVSIFVPTFKLFFLDDLTVLKLLFPVNLIVSSFVVLIEIMYIRLVEHPYSQWHSLLLIVFC